MGMKQKEIKMADSKKPIHEKISRICYFEKLSFFESAISNLFFSRFFFRSIAMKIGQVCWLARMGQNFDKAKRDNTF